MATRIRLRRVGRKRQASFRIVVAGGVRPRDGRSTETIGKYNPRTQPSYIEIDEARALYWLREGAEVSESVKPLFRKAGILKKFAEGAEGEGAVRIGDPQGKTVLTAQAQAPVAPAAEPQEAEKKVKPGKKAEAAAASAAEEKPEGAAEAKGAPAAEAAGEAEADSEAGGEAEAEAKAGKKTEGKGKAEAEADEADEGEAAESEDEEEKQEG